MADLGCIGDAEILEDHSPSHDLTTRTGRAVSRSPAAPPVVTGSVGRQTKPGLARWRGNGACVEVAGDRHDAPVRHSKDLYRLEPSVALGEWRAFADGIKGAAPAWPERRADRPDSRFAENGQVRAATVVRMPETEQDPSASTAAFRAFADQAGGEVPPAWSMRAPAKRVAILAVAVVCVAIALAVIAMAFTG